ncbi:AcaB family transcriptional regulator [Aromatoleum evansii]|uniref:AcaB family transcriptional regulator n=1 Tax=Aromatoleum evansii TaxID=59406 RepID=A0ABZ1AEA8_AROEV|nr:AcaB family transcriptional regulator [Aromatoleum evansii]
MFSVFCDDPKKRADKGLGFGILKSREPKVLELGFRSPYGYVIAELIVEFDYYVRVVKTLGRKALFSDKEAHDAIRQFTRPMRAAFEEFIRFETWLTKPDLLALSRADFLPGADANAQKRVAAVTGIFGAVPAGIYAGHAISRHSQRRIAISETEKAMLERVAADIAAIDSERGAAGDEATDDGLVD